MRIKDGTQFFHSYIVIVIITSSRVNEDFIKILSYRTDCNFLLNSDF